MSETVKIMTPEELHILQHSLGVDQFGRGRQYRNHFVTGHGSDAWDACCYLVALGLMQDHGKHQLAGSDHCFTVTNEGKKQMAHNSPLPPPLPKLTRSQRRYRDYLSAESSLSFGEWLNWQTRKHCLTP